MEEQRSREAQEEGSYCTVVRPDAGEEGSGVRTAGGALRKRDAAAEVEALRWRR
jgi:hypothetical protein